MAELIENPVSAYDVVWHIVDANPSISLLRIVTYAESNNWRDVAPDGELSPDQLKLALRQDPHPRSLIELSRTQFLNGSALELQRQLAIGQLMGIASAVDVDSGRRMHVPMM